MARVVALLLAVIVAWLGLIDHAFTAAPEVGSTAFNYAYDDHGHPAASNSRTTERGPPGWTYLDTTYDAVDRRSHGASVRPDGPTPGTASAYDHPARLVRFAGTPATTEGQARLFDGDLTSPSGTRSAANKVDDLAHLTTSQQRAVRSLQRQIDAHRSKLDDYIADPDAYDNLGYLERAPTPEIRQRIIDRRINHLETEIRTFQDQIDKLLGGGQ